MNIIVPWAMLGVAIAAIVLYGTWGRRKRRSKNDEQEVNPRKAA
jgi:FtsZ-interacting cell division protein ZipA